ncbi:MAG: DUF1614 domain-containing protein [bacterium]|nr:DUF1614 domain-containing protein [bacterium]
MPVGTLLLLAAGILVYFGVAHRVLDRMRLTDRAALVIIGLLLAGSFFNLLLVRRPVNLTVNVGGGLVPLGVAIWLIATADTAAERVRGVLAALVSGLAIFVLGRIIMSGLRAEPETMLLEPTYLFGAVAGVVGYLAGRSRRAAFIGGILGIVLADLAHFTELSVRGLTGRTWIGGGGAFDALVVAGILAVILAEVVGETRERLQGGPAPGPRAPGQTRLRGEEVGHDRKPEGDERGPV